MFPGYYQAHPKIARVNSSQNVSSKEQLPAPQAQRHRHTNLSHQQHHHHPQQRSSSKGHHHANNAKKAGFAIDEVEGGTDDNDDDWATESGAVTPNHNDSEDNSTASDEDGPPKPQQSATHKPRVSQQQLQQLDQKNRQLNGQKSEAPASLTESDKETEMLSRVDTMRAMDVQRLREAALALRPEQTQSLNAAKYRQAYRQEQREEPQEQALQNGAATGATVYVDDAKRNSSGITSHPQLRSKRSTRPASTYSTTTTATNKTNKSDLLRPHPLIRGPSLSHLNLKPGLSLPKPSPLAPLTVVPHASALSTSPPSMVNEALHASSSPTSLRTSSGGSTGSASEHDEFIIHANVRRMSFSSQRSGSTIPLHSSLTSGSTTFSGYRHDRKRTLSTLSSSSSSAALSSLAHLPMGTGTFPYVLSGTRPPSPQAHPISFFPPVNPHAKVESIHPLLPHPYLGNHLAVLAKKTPIRESLERVLNARNAVALVGSVSGVAGGTIPVVDNDGEKVRK